MYNTLREDIAAVIKPNWNGEITGQLMQQKLLEIVDNLDLGGLFLGFAGKVTEPDTEANGFYFSTEAGTYTNFYDKDGNPIVVGEMPEIIYRAKVNDIWAWKHETFGGTYVKANPEGEPTETLEKLQIGDKVYTAPQGDKGDKGDTGEQGIQGEPGPSNTLTIGTVQSGEEAAASITGESPEQVLNLTLPKGDAGQNAVNPFKGWYTTDNIPTTGQEGDYCNVSDTSVTPHTVTIYRWDTAQNAFVDTGETPDTATGETFASGETLQEVAIDSSGLANPVNTANPTQHILADAKDVMPLKSTLCKLDFTEVKIEPSTTTENYYIRANNIDSQSNNYDYGTFNVQGAKRIRFLGNFFKSEYALLSGFCFLDENQDFVKGFPYDNDSSLEISTYKEYVVDVPEGAVYFKTNIRTGQFAAEDFYCYLQYGDSVGDIADKTNNIDIELNGGTIVKTEKHNYTEYTYGYLFQRSNNTKVNLSGAYAAIKVEIPKDTQSLECIGALNDSTYYGIVWLDADENFISGVARISGTRNIYSGVISNIPSNAKYVSSIIETFNIGTIKDYSCYIKFNINRQVDGVINEINESISEITESIGDINDVLETKTVHEQQEHSSNEFTSANVVIRESNGNVTSVSGYGSVFLPIPADTESIEVRCFANNNYYNGVAFYNSLTFSISNWLSDYPRVSGKPITANSVITIPSSEIPTNAKAIYVTGIDAVSDGCYVVFNIATEVEGIVDKVDDLEETISSIGGVVKDSHTFVNKDNSMEQSDELLLSIPNCCKRYTIGCSMNVDDIWIGRISISSIDTYNKGHIEIDNTNIYVYDSTNVLSKTIAHGLTISQFLSVTLIQDSLSKFSVKVIVCSSTGNYVTTEDVYWYSGGNAPLKLTMINGTSSNAVLSLSIHDCDVWLFGDSYLDYIIRNIGQSLSNEIKNLYLDGYPGRTSQGGLYSLKKAVQVASPKVLIWALGMNNGDTSTSVNADWLAVFNEVKEICKSNAIELVLATIPTTPIVNNNFKNNVIKESGYRYVDIASSVGADINGDWYEGLLSSDNIHPTNKGAKIIFEKYITDLPNVFDKN